MFYVTSYTKEEKEKLNKSLGYPFIGRERRLIAECNLKEA